MAILVAQFTGDGTKEPTAHNRHCKRRTNRGPWYNPWQYIRGWWL